MKKNLVIIFLSIAFSSFGQMHLEENRSSVPAFKGGEWLKFKLSYSNFLTAGYSTMAVEDIVHKEKEAYHITGIGKSTGFVSLFFKVRDNYQSFMYKESLKPFRFIRKINEGGYKKDKEILFDYETDEAIVKNHKHNTVKRYPISSNIQDMLSTLYFLRNQNVKDLKVGDEIELQLFFDQEVNNFKLRLLGREVIKTKFGKVNTLKFRPMVQAGRVFKEQESVTVWISDDKNKIPLRIKASLAVGSLRAELDEFKGLANPFNMIFDN